VLVVVGAACAGCGERITPPEQVSGDLVACFIDVGQGDACLVRCPDGTSMLIDTGPAHDGAAVIDSLHAAGVTRIDHLIFTHPHEDHIGGGEAVLAAFDVGKVYMPRTSHTTSTYEHLLEAIQAKGLTITEARAGTILFDLGNLTARFIGPTEDYEAVNDCSAVIFLQYTSRTFIFAGDASITAETDMLDGGWVAHADCLKVGHHGSATSTGQPFLDVVKPHDAVISVAADNSYGHPAPATLERLEGVGATIYRTDQSGTITVTSDGTSLEVQVAGARAEPGTGQQNNRGAVSQWSVGCSRQSACA